MDFEQQQNYLNTVRDMADEAAYNTQREQQYTDDQLLAMALGNIGEYIHDNSHTLCTDRRRSTQRRRLRHLGVRH
jgi:hypothetical protein